VAWCEIDRPSLLPSCLDFGTLPHVLGDPAHAADTLLGFRLPALRLGMRSKEAAHAKFYVFDAGVARAAAGWARETMPEEWKGHSFETLALVYLGTKTIVADGVTVMPFPEFSQRLWAEKISETHSCKGPPA